jgi:hypothetical protein
MVEQSSGLFLVEPFAAESGKLSGGVLEEVVLHEHLRQYEVGQGEDRRLPPVVYHPPEAELRRKVGSVMDTCVHASQMGDISGWPKGGAEIELIRGALRNEPLGEWEDADPNEVGDALSSFFHKLPLEPKPEIVVAGKKGSLQKGKKKTGVFGVRARLGHAVISALRGIANERPDFALSSVRIDYEGTSLHIGELYAHGRDLAHAMAQKVRDLDRVERPPKDSA